MQHRVPYCPQNGCGMANGTAMKYVVICKNCGAAGWHCDKLCKDCKHCIGCGRIGKKYYIKDERSE